MERVIDFIFDHLLKEICGEGERRIKLQAFSASLVAVLGVRKLFILVFFYCFACFLCALSFFGALFVATDQWSSAHFVWRDPRLVLCLGVWTASTAILVFTVREKKWAAAFGLQEKISELENEDRSARGGGIQEAELTRIIERVLDERAKRQQDPLKP